MTKKKTGRPGWSNVAKARVLAELGLTKIEVIMMKYGISKASIYNWQKELEGSRGDELKSLIEEQRWILEREYKERARFEHASQESDIDPNDRSSALTLSQAYDKEIHARVQVMENHVRDPNKPRSLADSLSQLPDLMEDMIEAMREVLREADTRDHTLLELIGRNLERAAELTMVAEHWKLRQLARLVQEDMQQKRVSLEPDD